MVFRGNLNVICSIDSPVVVTVREAAKDDELCGYKIPAGTKIMLAPAVVHHHPDVWGQDADKFRPERFIEQGGIPEQAKGDILVHSIYNHFYRQNRKNFSPPKT